MFGNGAISNGIDSIFSFITNCITTVIEYCMSALFANYYVALAIFILLINIVAILLMKKDKEYAKDPKARRVRESTLLLTAFVGGAYGEYYAMYKYKHKTLHKKFIYGVPIAMVFHFALLSYSIFYTIIT